MSNESWDAYEALDGVPLVKLLIAPHPWRAVRQWLADLAREIDAALDDGSLGRLTVDRVWITREGRAKLLDFQPPGVPDPSRSTASASSVSSQVFLSEVATIALAVTTRASADNSRLPKQALPVSASALLDDLARGSIEQWSTVVERATSLLSGADRIERRRRVATLALCAAIPVAWALFVGTMSMLMYRMNGQLSDTEELSSALSVLTRNTDGAFDRVAAETYVAGRFGRTMIELQNWSDPLTVGHLARHRQLIDRILADHPHVSSDDLAAAIATLGTFFERQAAIRHWMPWMSALAMAVYLFVPSGPRRHCGSVDLPRRLPLADVRHCRRHERRRARVTGASTVPWARCVGNRHRACRARFCAVVPRCGLDCYYCRVGPHDLRRGRRVAVVHPERGLQDRIAGTYLVPR